LEGEVGGGRACLAQALPVVVEAPVHGDGSGVGLASLARLRQSGRTALEAFEDAGGDPSADRRAEARGLGLRADADRSFEHVRRELIPDVAARHPAGHVKCRVGCRSADFEQRLDVSAQGERHAFDHRTGEGRAARLPFRGHVADREVAHRQRERPSVADLGTQGRTQTASTRRLGRGLGQHSRGRVGCIRREKPPDPIQHFAGRPGVALGNPETRDHVMPDPQPELRVVRTLRADELDGRGRAGHGADPSSRGHARAKQPALGVAPADPDRGARREPQHLGRIRRQLAGATPGVANLGEEFAWKAQAIDPLPRPAALIGAVEAGASSHAGVGGDGSAEAKDQPVVECEEARRALEAGGVVLLQMEQACRGHDRRRPVPGRGCEAFAVFDGEGDRLAGTAGVAVRPRLDRLAGPIDDHAAKPHGAGGHSGDLSRLRASACHDFARGFAELAPQAWEIDARTRPPRALDHRVFPATRRRKARAALGIDQEAAASATAHVQSQQIGRAQGSPLLSS